MRVCTKKHLFLLLLCALVVVSPVRAGWFWGADEPEPILDATFTIELPFRPSFDISIDQFDVTLIYQAYKPDEKGVKTRINKNYSNPTIWVPWVTSYNEKLAVVRELKIKPEWIQLAAPNRAVIHLPERLAGPGDYRLRELHLACKAEICHEEHAEYRRFLFSVGHVESELPAILSLGKDRASTFTADYRGILMYAHISDGSHADRLSGHLPKDSRAVQDAAGVWHISDTAFQIPYAKSCSHASWNPLSPLSPIDAKKYPTLSWAVPFTELQQGEVYPGYIEHDDGTRTVKSILQYTGCIELEAAGSTYSVNDSEVRQYHYREGKLWARDISRHVHGAYFREWIEFDGDQKLLFFKRHGYDDSTKTDKNLQWNRLEHEAYPDEVQAESPEWGIKKAIMEGDSVLGIVK